MKPEPAKEVIFRETECPNGHGIKLEIVANSPNTIQWVKCPTCGVRRMGLIGKLISVTPANPHD
jgi:hypothetical protein